jgi:hypothetical protein
LLFQNGIVDPYFSTVKALINSQRSKYDTFEKVKEEYLNYMRTSPRLDYARDPGNDSRHISETRTNKKPPTQAEIDACVHIKCRKYSWAEYDKFTPAEKAKHYQHKEASGLVPKKRTVSQLETESNEKDETATDSVTNSDNPALVRQNKLHKPE